MNTLDYTILIGGALFIILGIYWGLIRQVLSLVGLVVGVAMAGRYGPDVADWLSSFVADPVFAGAFGFIAVLLLVSAAASLVASLLRIFVGLLFLGWIDHLLGGVLGLLQAALAAAALLLGMATFPLPAWSEALQSSTLAEPLLRVGGIFTPILPELFQSAIRTALGF
jgi:membrane protein required for colicin V production